jgi:hypothetical protein
MYMIAHLASGLIAGILWNRYKNTNDKGIPLLLAFSAMISDFIDKPIGSLIFNTGRWFGHSLLFITIFGTLLVLNSNKVQMLLNKIPQVFNYEYKFPVNSSYFIWIGMYIHVLGDLPNLGKEVLFWPLFGDFPKTGSNTFLFGFDSPITVFAEIIGLAIFIIYGYKQKWTQKEWLLLFILISSYLLLFVFAYTFLVVFQVI